jgi:hypothetical protein
MKRGFGVVVLLVVISFGFGCNSKKGDCLDKGEWGACVETCDVDKDEAACAKLKLIGMEACTKGDKEKCRKLCEYYKVEPACELEKK